MTFVHPTGFILACAIPVAVFGLYLYDRARRRQLTNRLGELPVIQKVIATASPGRRLA
jgi:putative copper export protein